jgi:hypothetical protein
VRAAAVELARERLVLQEDVEIVVESALERYDYFVGLRR